MSINKMVTYAVLMAVLMIITVVINIPLPGGMGYINVSDAFIMIIASVLKAGPAALIAGIGCMLADITLGYGQYALYTLAIKAIEALLVVALIKTIKIKGLAFAVGALWMVVGYGLTDSFLSGSLSYFMISVSANLPQAVGCVVIAVLSEPIFKKLFTKQNLG